MAAKCSESGGIGFGHFAGLRVVSEHVETASQAAGKQAKPKKSLVADTHKRRAKQCGKRDAVARIGNHTQQRGDIVPFARQQERDAPAAYVGDSSPIKGAENRLHGIAAATEYSEIPEFGGAGFAWPAQLQSAAKRADT